MFTARATRTAATLALALIGAAHSAQAATFDLTTQNLAATSVLFNASGLTLTVTAGGDKIQARSTGLGVNGNGMDTSLNDGEWLLLSFSQAVTLTGLSLFDTGEFCTDASHDHGGKGGGKGDGKGGKGDKGHDGKGHDGKGHGGKHGSHQPDQPGDFNDTNTFLFKAVGTSPTPYTTLSFGNGTLTGLSYTGSTFKIKAGDSFQLRSITAAPTTPVPEADAALMALAGLGIVGLRTLRRRQNT